MALKIPFRVFCVSIYPSFIHPSGRLICNFGQQTPLWWIMYANWSKWTINHYHHQHHHHWPFVLFWVVSTHLISIPLFRIIRNVCTFLFVAIAHSPTYLIPPYLVDIFILIGFANLRLNVTLWTPLLSIHMYFAFASNKNQFKSDININLDIYFCFFK